MFSIVATVERPPSTRQAFGEPSVAIILGGETVTRQRVTSGRWTTRCSSIAKSSPAGCERERERES